MSAGSFHGISEHNGFQFYHFAAFDALPGVRHLFTTRVGGKSKGVYHSANFSYTRGDESTAVDANYSLAVRALDDSFTINDVVVSKQTHSVHVRTVTEADRGMGAVRERDFDDTDGLITNVPGIVLTTLHADCTPLFFADPKRHAVGLAHAGWRGTLQRIGEVLVHQMEQEFQTDPEDLIVGIGPVISAAHYEVGSEVADAFAVAFGEALRRYEVFSEGVSPEKPHLDLTKANRMVLEEAGVRADHIVMSSLCTYAHPELFFSHRRDKEARGNMAAMIAIAAS